MTRDEMLRLTRGIALTPVTPFKKDGTVDDKGIHRLVEFLFEKGLSGQNGFLIPLSTTGSFVSLSSEEKNRAAKIFLEAASGGIPVVLGCNHVRLAETIDLAKFAEGEGAVAIMVSPPFYWKPTDAQIINHYHQICHSINIGVIMYNNHWASQVDISVETIEKICEENTNLIGLKESTYSIPKLMRAIRQVSHHINILNGLGEAFEPLYAQLGCVGFTSWIVGNVFPELSVRIHSHLVKKNFDEARQLVNRIVPYTDFMHSLSGGEDIAALTHLLSRFGVCEDVVRAPLIPLTNREIEELEEIVDNL
jgi:4-hydroxy-tetrahydrodipicolinate synthase